MSILPRARANGESVEISRRVVPFSYWPVHKTARYHELKPVLFTTNPWGLIEQSIKEDCPHGAKKAALAFLQQAEANFLAASIAGTAAAKPVLLYYSYLNLAKALILMRGLRTNCDNAHHGIKDRRNPATSTSINAAYLECDASAAAQVKVFSEFLKCIDGVGLAIASQFELKSLMPQTVPGHRMWSAAVSRRERFVAIDKIEFKQDSTNKNIWLTMTLQAADVSRLNISRKKLIEATGLATAWREVDGPDDFVTLEQTTVNPFVIQPGERLDDLIKSVRPRVWSTVLSHPPYRRYYLNLTPAAERTKILPELASMYSLAFYLGSITRYRPHHFEALTDGPYGRFIQACLSDHPTQFVYLMASEFSKQEITKPAII